MKTLTFVVSVFCMPPLLNAAALSLKGSGRGDAGETDNGRRACGKRVKAPPLVQRVGVTFFVR